MRILLVTAATVALVISFVGHTESASLFPLNYQESRASFKRRCLESPIAKCESFHVPSAIDSDLSVDTALFSRHGNKKLLVLISGVHGAEAYAGAAVQELAASRHLEGLNRAGIDVLMIHALNPFGFKNNRRVTENNINLNRNFTDDGEIFKIHNSSYSRLVDILEPKGPVQNVGRASWSNAWALAKRYIADGFNSKDLIVAIGQGQYDSEKGLEFGGRRVEPNIEIFKTIYALYTPMYDRVLTLDLHTGLGEEQTLHLMSPKDPGDRAEAEARRIFAFDPLKDKIVFTDGNASGFYQPHGCSLDFIKNLLTPDQAEKSMGLALEFGTLGGSMAAKVSTINRLILENQGFWNGYASEAVQAQVEADFLELFRPSDLKWQKQVLEKSSKILKAIEQKF